MKKKMAPNFLDMATTLENKRARWSCKKRIMTCPELPPCGHPTLTDTYYYRQKPNPSLKLQINVCK